MLQNDRLLRTLRREPVDCTPIWLMRQAGRYLPEYRDIRAKAGDFMTLCKTPELACEVTLQPLKRFPLDAAIIFSDILTIPDAMGLGLHFIEGEGPLFKHPVATKFDIENLGIPDPEADLGYVMDAIRLTKKELEGQVPLIGFAGSPWTIACYMVEGGSSKNFTEIKSLLYKEPKLLHLLLSKLTQAITLYLDAQIAAGVQVVMIFDTWGGILSPSAYEEFSLNYMAQIIKSLKDKVPTILFTKNGGQWLEKISATNCTAVGLDWMTDIKDARHRIGKQSVLQGNLDPAILFSNPEAIRTEVARILEHYGPGSGHIFNLGHGILPTIPPENVAVLVESVHELSIPYHK